MKQRISIMALGIIMAVLPASAWTPKDLFKGKSGFIVSVAVVTAANFFDYHYTVKDVYSGAGHEANPLFLNNQGVLSKDRLKGFKIGSGALIVGEVLVIHRAPRYRPLFEIANYSVGAALGFQAYRGRQIFNNQ